MTVHPKRVCLAMRRSLHRAVAVVPWLMACIPAVSPDEAPRATEADRPLAHEVTPVAAVAPRTSPEGPFELVLDDAGPRAVLEALGTAPGRDLAPAHAERAGWSVDGQTFAHCRHLPGLDCTECRLLHHDGVTHSLESGPGCGEGAVPSATLEARLAELALGPALTTWSAGANVVLVVETRQVEPTNAGQPRAVLQLGARRREGGPPGWLVHVDPCEGCGTDQVCAAQAHFDALALDPTGTQLAVLVHALASDGSDSLRVELLATKRVVKAAGAPR